MPFFAVVIEHLAYVRDLNVVAAAEVVVVVAGTQGG